MLTRGANRKVIYTAHGFHFFKGSSIWSWVVFFPFEWVLSFFTDCIVTINREDYGLSKRFLMSAQTYLLPSVGVDCERFSAVDAEKKVTSRRKLGLATENKVIVYVAQQIERKNHDLLIRSFARCLKRDPKLWLVLVGDGPLRRRNEGMCADLGIGQRVIFAGTVSNVEDYYWAGDLHISTSRQEGFSVNNIEAMACGLPVLCTAIRGHTEAIVEGRNGWLVKPNISVEELAEKICSIFASEATLREVGANNVLDARNFSTQNSVSRMADIYHSVLAVEP